MNVISEVIAYLDANLRARAYANVPGDRPKTFVTVERTGGQSANRLDHPELAIQSWAPSNLAAYNLALEVDKLLLDMPEATDVMGVSRSSITDWPDPESRSFRYQGIYQLTTSL